MKKNLVFIGTLLCILSYAQKSNEILRREFEQQKIQNEKKFDAYAERVYGKNPDSSTKKKIDSLKSRLGGFHFNVPYFLEEHDTRQLSNSNSDQLNTAGNITGLSGAFNGENIKYTIYDGGRIYEAHTAFNNATGRITNKEASTQDYSDHSTGVGSFIGGKSVNLSNGGVSVGNAKGVAINSTIDSYMFATTTLPGDASTSSVFDKILTAAPNISNHSYGINAGWDEKYDSSGNLSSYVYNGSKSGNTFYDFQGTYDTNDYNYDALVYNNPSFIIVKSAGNSFGMGPNGASTTIPKYYRTSSGQSAFGTSDTPPANNCAQGYDCIGPGSLAKNIIVVGATDIITTNNYRYTAASDVVHSDYSSAGPRDDGGIKPDISAVGTDVLYAATSTTGSSLWAGGSGTSFSAPVVTGIIGLWTQIYKQLFNNATLNAASAKVLTVHSAAEAGNIGPDPWFGWGFIDAKKGAELLVGKANNTVIFNDETLNSGVKNSKTITASGSEPLKATISWIDPEYEPNYQLVSDVYNNRTSKLINDLDLRIIDLTTNTVYYPWKLNANSPMTPATKADNTVDNVEQVVIDAPVAGRSYRIEITNKGTLVDESGSIAPQNYSIMVTGQTTSSLATSDVVKDSGIIVSPTLTKDFVKVLKAPKKSIFNVYDLSGKKLQSGTINSNEESIDLTSYTKGIYIIEVKTDRDIVSKKVIKE
ncbi:Por secretion system C-terminal sorting domain-containing protein [Chryseobacterium taeanense]|uniref:Por secretion system C-terminal sorting domain-containing protein n=1 Tax=Chryseobacterium taeanense TaxID=311334 RepID=A0A1G8LGL0_9FLAO|nr:S8 family peptidase [Chryseobacterium taeanense]SDI54783.1 Por secretion system C-terminal sorting domain-containing protein [Chryseobacterium taeanense]